jgi:hypothetical protein
VNFKEFIKWWKIGRFIGRELFLDECIKQIDINLNDNLEVEDDENKKYIDNKLIMG